MPTINIADPTCPLPDVLIFDASIILSLIYTKGKNYKTIESFFKRISTEAAAGRVLCLAPTRTFDECYFKIIQQAFKKDLPAHQSRLISILKKPQVSWNDLYKDSPHLIKNYEPTLTAARKTVRQIPITPIEPVDLGKAPPEIESLMFYHITNTFILPGDAYLVAIADRLDIPHIATLDKDFSRAGSSLSIYTIV